MELTFLDGNVTLEEHIPYDKGRMGKVRLTRDGMTERVWIALSPEGQKKYQSDDTYGETIIAVLCNDSLAGVPWGSYLKIELRGDECPVCSFEETFGDKASYTLADWAAGQAAEGVFKDLQEGKYKLEDEGVREYLTLVLKTAPESDTVSILKTTLEQ